MWAKAVSRAPRAGSLLLNASVLSASRDLPRFLRRRRADIPQTLCLPLLVSYRPLAETSTTYKKPPSTRPRRRARLELPFI